MGYRDKDGNTFEQDSFQDKFLKLMYGSAIGRMVAKALCMPPISKIGGALLDSAASKLLIRPFIQTHAIDMNMYVPKQYASYNAFFKREILPEYRPVCQEKGTFISPSDGRISVYPISGNQVFSIKNARYTIGSLLRDQKLAEKYAGGWCFLIRLTVDNYHHFCYVDSGQKTGNRLIPGVLHTVNPVAGEFFDIYKENSREYTMIRTENFGDVIQMEVGAMMVGKIVNRHEQAVVSRGEEKGWFEFGGSTVIVLVEKDRVTARMDLIKNTKEGYETIVRMGEAIGYGL